VKNAKSVFSLLWVFLFTVQSNANLVCANLFNRNERVEIQMSAEKDKPSEVFFHESPLSTNPDTALLDFLSMASYTRSVEVVKTKLGKTRISKFDLGLDLGKGYSIEIRYRADERADLRFTAESATIVSPTNRTEKIAPHLIDFNELKFKEKIFSLSDIFPEGRDVHLNIPIEIKGDAIPMIEKMITHLPFFTKQEMRQLVLSESVLKIKVLGHLRFTKNYLKEFAIKAPFKLFTNTALAVSLVLMTGYNFKDYMIKTVTPETNITSNSNISWSQSSIQKILKDSNLTANSALKTEMTKLMDVAKLNSNPTTVNPQVAQVFQSQSRDFLWITESKDFKTKSVKTILFISHDNDGENKMNYMGIEINTADYPALTQQLKAEGRYLRAN
jgi:hypothetical protein